MDVSRAPLWADWAIQYYVVGRFAARTDFNPIHGNLLHHSVEMFLKTGLADIVNPKEMRTKYRHDLMKLWQRFREKTADPALDPFDATVQALHKFEEIRYPDTFSYSAIQFGVLWYSARTFPSMMGAEKFEVALPDGRCCPFHIRRL